MKKNYWTQEEEKHLMLVMEAYSAHSKSRKWVQIAKKFNQACPEAKRNPTQCRQRWNYHIKPKQQFPKGTDHQIIIKNIETFIENLRIHKKKWSNMVEHFPSQTYNSIKNFFNTSIKKGVRYLNFFNYLVRKPTIFRRFQSDLLHKLMIVWDGDKNNVLNLQSEQVSSLAPKIIENIIRCSLCDSVKMQGLMTEEEKQLFLNLYQLILKFLKLCRYKKWNAPKVSQEDFVEPKSRNRRKRFVKLEVTTRKGKIIKMKQHQKQKQKQKQKEVKIELSCRVEEPKHVQIPQFNIKQQQVDPFSMYNFVLFYPLNIVKSEEVKQEFSPL